MVLFRSKRCPDIRQLGGPTNRPRSGLTKVSTSVLIKNSEIIFRYSLS